MAISFENTSSHYDTIAGNTVPAPTGIVDKDILVGWGYLASGRTLTWPTGFVQWGVQGPVDPTYRYLHLGWKRAASETGDYAWSWTTGTSSFWQMVVVRGCVTTGDPMHALSNTLDIDDSNNTIYAASIGTTTETALLWSAVVYSGEDPVITPPGGFTDKLNSAFSTYFRSDLAYKLRQPEGTTGSQNGTFAGAARTTKGAMMVALRAAVVPKIIVV